MRRLLHLVLWVAVAAVVAAGCGRTHNATLTAIDSLIAAAPDSAVALLEATDPDTLAGDRDDNRAYRALLLAQARYKAYIVATSDSDINLALSHYATSTDHDKRLRATLYKGCVMEELGQPDSAIYWYRRALALTDPDDHYNKGYVHLRMAELYYNHLPLDTAFAPHYKQAIQEFEQSKHQGYLLVATADLASSYCFFSYEQAEHYFKKADSINAIVNDQLIKRGIRVSRSGLCYLQGKYEESARLAVAALEDSVHPINISEAVVMASKSLSQLHRIDSAEMYLNLIPNSPDDTPSLSDYYGAKSDFLLAKGDSSGYLYYKTLGQETAEGIIERQYLNHPHDTELACELEIAREEKAAKKRTLLTISGSVVMLLAAIIALLLYNRRRQHLRSERQHQESAAVRNRLEQSLSELQQQLQEMERQNTDENRQLTEQLKQNNAVLMAFGKLIMESQNADPEVFITDFKRQFVGTGRENAPLQMFVDMLHDNACSRLLKRRPDLTTSDVNLACLMALGFDNHNIGICLDLKDGSVRVKKSRLKKKLGIELDQDILKAT